MALVQIGACQAPFGARSDERGVEPLAARDPIGQGVAWYSGSYALLVGNSSYLHGWPRLESVTRELAAVRAVLTKQGFVVEEVTNADGDRLRSAFKSFIDRHDYERDNRLLFYFAGHGFTRAGGKAYLVPVDAPQPRADERTFLARALTMTQILAWAREMEAKQRGEGLPGPVESAVGEPLGELGPVPARRTRALVLRGAGRQRHCRHQAIRVPGCRLQ